MPETPTFALRKPRGAVKWILIVLVAAFILTALGSRVAALATAVELLRFEPALLLRGERIWSPLSFWLINRPDAPFDLLFAGVAIYFFGAALEDSWGTRRLLGFLVTIQVGAAALALLAAVLGLGNAPISGASPLAAALVVAWGLMNPKTEMYFFFFPLKGIYLVLITVGFTVFNAITAGPYAVSAAFGALGASAAWAVLYRGPLRRMMLEGKLRRLEAERERFRRGEVDGDAPVAGLRSFLALRLRLFGVPIEIRALFWLVTILMGWTLAFKTGEPLLLVVWVAVVLVSVLVHELGHAAAIRQQGLRPSIVLHALGGSTERGGIRPISRSASAFISFAGPLAGFLFGAVAYGGARLAHATIQPMPPVAGFGLEMLIFVNVVWGFFNLLPVLPWDGGHILEQALGPRRERLTVIVSLVAAVGIGAACVFYEWYWAAGLMALSVFQTYPRLRATRQDAPAAARDVARRRAAAANLRVISGGKDDDSKRWLN